VNLTVRHPARRARNKSHVAVVAACVVGALLLLGALRAGEAKAVTDPDLLPYVENPGGGSGPEVRSVTPGTAAIPRGGGGGGGFLKGYTEPNFSSGDAAKRGFAFSESAAANSSIARINLSWRSATVARPANPSDPSDPAYRFGAADAAVVDAVTSGHRVMLTVYSAPAWAEGPNRPPGNEYPAGTWKPQPEEFGKFVEAVANRYSGSYTPPGGSSLPRVPYLAAWNEPNLTDYITPQSTNGKIRSGDMFRELVNAATAGVQRSSNPDLQIVTGGTAPYGDQVGGRRTRPLQFLREFLCLTKSLKRDKKCEGGKAKFDVLGHHPITLSGGPNRSALHPDDVAMPDVKNLVETLRAAEKRNSIKGSGHPVWATEFWWETNPPDAIQGIQLAKHARWVQESLYLLWKQGASAAIWLQLIDDQLAPDGFSGMQGGHLFLDNSRKPAYDAFRFPFHAQRKSKKSVKVWTIAPNAGSVAIEKRVDSGWKRVETFGAQDGKPKQAAVELKGKQALRASLGGETTIPVTVGKR
jgi:hypothetical protein